VSGGVVFSGDEAWLRAFLRIKSKGQRVTWPDIHVRASGRPAAPPSTASGDRRGRFSLCQSPPASKQSQRTHQNSPRKRSRITSSR